MSARLLGALLLLSLAGAAAAQPPRKVTIQYDISYNGTVIAEGTETLEHDGRSYRIDSEARGKGLFAVLHRGAIKRSSRGLVLPAGLRPVEFLDQRGDRTPESARFDWSSRRVALERSNGTRQALPAQDDMQDRLSFVWNFAFGGTAGREVAATIVDGRGTTSYRYTVAERQTLKTPAGTFETLHLVKLKDPGDARGTELWLASARSLLPVRLLVIDRDGTRMDTVVTRITP
jgi:hypothetical protein